MRALRPLVRTIGVSADDVIADLGDLDLRSHAHLDLLDRIWAVRDNVSAYVGMYIALAEALDATLVTSDGALATAPGHSARIEVVVLAGLTEREG